MPAPAPNPDALRKQIHGTCRAASILAAISVVCGLIGMLIALGGPKPDPALIGFHALSLLTSGFVLYAMRSAMGLRSYGLALSGAVVSLIPWTGACMLFSMGIGVACFAMLAQAQAAALFPRSLHARVPHGLPLAALLVSAFGFCVFPAGLVGSALGVWVLAKAGADFDPRARRLAVAAAAVGAGAFILSGIATGLALPFILGIPPPHPPP